MEVKIVWLNCLWLILPLLIWNLIFGRKLTDPRISSDANSTQWQLKAENVMRILVFVLPLFIPFPQGRELQFLSSKIGIVVYIVGTLVYFVSWIPLMYAPGSRWSNRGVGLLSPAVTPVLSFLGIAILGKSLIYALVSILFIALHTMHGIQNL